MSEPIIFASPDAFRKLIRQVCDCKGSRMVDDLKAVSGLYCNLETRNEGVDYIQRANVCSKCGTPYDVRLVILDPRKVLIIENVT